MLHHRTTDPVERLLHIAEREAERRESYDVCHWLQVYRETADELLEEYCGEQQRALAESGTTNEERTYGD